MDQHPEKAPHSEWTDFTFFIEIQLDDAHPGVIRLHELRKDRQRFLKHGYILLHQPEPGKETVGETIARLIYEDQTDNRQGKYQGPRWNFQHPARLHFLHKIEQPDSAGHNAIPLVRELGTAHIPGGLDKAAILTCIAQVIDKGWQPLSKAATTTENVQREEAESSEPDFPLTIRCMHNNRFISGPVVFMATEQYETNIEYCAILRGPHDLDPAQQWYHLFRFEQHWEILFLCDLGIHAPDDPILLSSDAEFSPSYWVHERVRIPVIGEEEMALSEIPSAVDNTADRFAQAIPCFSLFCSACCREHRPALSASLLQEAAHRGYVTTLCSHIFWCPICACWSTPTEHHLPPALIGRGCTHARPSGWESRLTANAQEQDIPALPAAQPPPAHGRPASHPFYEDSFNMQYEMDNMLYPPRHPGQYLSRLIAEQETDEYRRVMLVTFLENCRYKTAGDDSETIPEGTRLIGIWNTEQPKDTRVCALTVNNTSWTIAKSQVRMSPMEKPLGQVDIAGEDEEQAIACEEHEDYVGAQTFWARVIVEYAACGWPPVRLALYRKRRADILLRLGQYAEAVYELEHAAQAYSGQAYDPLNRAVGIYLDYAEQAVDTLIPLATIHLQHTHDPMRARVAVEQLAELNTLITKRYERKVRLLLTLCGFFLDLGERREALTFFDQANRLYTQQLAGIADRSSLLPVTAHLHLIKERLQTSRRARTINFGVTTHRSDDIEDLLALLRAGHLPVAEVIREATPWQTFKDVGTGLNYMASLKITFDS